MKDNNRVRNLMEGKLPFIISFLLISLIIFFIPVSLITVIFTLISSMLLGKISGAGKWAFLIYFPILLFIFFEVYLIVFSLGFKNSTEGIKGNETVIVLGSGVDKNGPMPHTRARLDAASDLYSKFRGLDFIVSGARGKDEPDDESAVMAKYLREKGIPSGKIFEDPKATDTIENIKYSKEIIVKENLSRKVIIVSNEYHLLRAGIIAGFEGLDYKLYAGFTHGFRSDYYIKEFLSAVKVFFTYWFNLKD